MQLKYSTIAIASFAFATFNFIDNHAFAQSSTRDKKIVEDANQAKEEFIKADPLLKNIFNESISAYDSFSKERLKNNADNNQKIFKVSKEGSLRVKK